MRNRQAASSTAGPRPERLGDIVESGLCVGCGLCRAIAGKDRIELVVTPEGRERPVERGKVSRGDWRRILRTCPGVRVEGTTAELSGHDAKTDRTWGPYHRVCLGHAADPDVRFRAASGGVLTALAAWLVDSGRVSFVVQVRASPDRPARTETVTSEDGADVARSTGSRYGPAAPLATIMDALDRDEPFAFVGKPCDVGALRLLAGEDDRVARRCKAMLALVCGGASEFRKTGDLLDELGLREDELSLLRYRGYGNPGCTRIETHDGRAFEKTYLEMWGDEGRWRLQNRCKICPDAIGEVADVAAADYWPGGAPAGEDAGFNSIIARTPAGRDLLRDAEAAGAIRIVRELTMRDMDDTQPHQVRKKESVWARLAGMRAAQHLAPEVVNLRIEEMARERPMAANLAEARGARARVRQGRMTEPPAMLPGGGSRFRGNDGSSPPE